MMKQTTFANAGFDKYAKTTKRALFLAEMEAVMPWTKLCALVEPYYPKAGNGRPPIGLERMLRIHCLQHWFNLADPAVEEALYESVSMRQFVGIDLGREAAPDETTICKFRHLLEAHSLGGALFATINAHLQQSGLKVATGTIVDASISNGEAASTKNRDGTRDPEMHSTKKGHDWHFGMKAHIGIDSQTKLIHSAAVTAAHVHDSQVLGELLHGRETRVWGDSAYHGQRAVIKAKAPQAQDFTHHKGARGHPLSPEQRATNTTKSRVRAKVEHLFRVIKCQFGFAKVRYRGLMKNAQRLFMVCALANVYLARRHLLRRTAA
jgi:transposase, IS5 family